MTHMNKAYIIKEVRGFVQKTLQGESTGHDWWHIDRVQRLAVRIAKQEKAKADIFVVELAALLHDIADWKFHKGDTTKGSGITRKLLRKYKVDEEIISQVCDIIENISFKGAKVKNKISTPEGKIVQDADRLDALGAIGIARAFAYGGYQRRILYDPKGKTKLHASFSQYRKGADSTIHHFYEKLLFLKDRMNTRTGRKIALQRHAFLESYLKQFFKEWEAKV
jgi:uncharacterized protein